MRICLSLLLQVLFPSDALLVSRTEIKDFFLWTRSFQIFVVPKAHQREYNFWLYCQTKTRSGYLSQASYQIFFFCMSVDCTSICLTCITFSKLFIQSNQLSCCRWFIPSVWWLFIILWKQVHSKYCTWNLISHPEVFVKYNAVITYGYATHWPLFGNHGFK